MTTTTDLPNLRDRDEVLSLIRSLYEMAGDAANEAEAKELASRIAQITRAYRIANGIGLPTGPAEQAQEIDSAFVIRSHTQYLSDRIAQAVRDTERGQNRRLVISLPPRSGKSTLVSLHFPVWLLRRHPDWKIITTSHDSSLTTDWSRTIREIIEDRPTLGIALRKDAGAYATWWTREGGGVLARSTRAGITGRGARVFIIDDPVRDFEDAHSVAARERLWNWWLSVVNLRLEPPYVVIVVMTRWHEDDFVGRLLSTEYEGDPREWEKLAFPAIAEGSDLLGRAAGDPLYSPIIKETVEQALERWENVKETVGTYTFASMYQQRPAPAKGSIFDSSWWRFWTTDPGKATRDGRVVYLDPSSLTGASWLDSWDLGFDAAEGAKTSWVVGQRWAREGANRFLLAQQREHMNFTQTIAAMKKWALRDSPASSPYGEMVNLRLVEKKANGAAAINVLQDTISGLKPINPTASKEIRARAVTPECESGNVYLPHPTDIDNEWVADLLSELRNFPHDAHDDQVDALTQALSNMRDVQGGGITIPGSPRGGLHAVRTGITVPGQGSSILARAAQSDLDRRRSR